MGLLHIGVWLLLGIDFHFLVFVYAGFFLVPSSRLLLGANEIHVMHTSTRTFSAKRRRAPSRAGV
jgi:hypothetical protein